MLVFEESETEGSFITTVLSLHSTISLKAYEKHVRMTDYNTYKYVTIFTLNV